jgi:hypothetical protein
MNTIAVDIKEVDILNFITLDKCSLSLTDSREFNELLSIYPFTLYRGRMMGSHMVTIQIPLENYIIFLEHNLIK